MVVVPEVAMGDGRGGTFGWHVLFCVRFVVCLLVVLVVVVLTKLVRRHADGEGDSAV